MSQLTRILLLASLGCASSYLSLAQSATTTGSIAGTVTDQQGNALSGAQVSYASFPQSVANGTSDVPMPGDIVVSGTTTAGANGAFSVSGLPPAQYGLCASVPSLPYVNPCTWAQGVAANVSPGAATTVTMVLQKGVYLNVAVNDPLGLLPPAIDGPLTQRKLIVGVIYGAGAYQGATNTSVTAGVHSYQLTIPVGVPFWLRLYSTDVSLTDASGTLLPSPAGGVSFQASPGLNQSFVFTVSGAASNAH